MYRYIGNKTKLLPYIVETVRKEIGPAGTVCDLMAGTGSVSLELREQGYKLISNDVMNYSKHHLTVDLLMNCEPSFEGLADLFATEDRYGKILDYLDGLPGVESYFFKEFSPDGKPANGCSPRKYFSSENAKKIDAIREKINLWIAEGRLSEKEESLLKHSLIMAANEVANISGTYGYFLSSFNKSSLAKIKLKRIQFSEKGGVDNVVLNDFAENVAKDIKADLCYIDPPYIKRQYAANYHVLETLALGDYPEAIGKSGLRNWWNKHSKFCTKTRIFDSFDKVFEMNCPIFVISYSEDGLIPINDLVSYFKTQGETEVIDIDYKRFRSNHSSLKTQLKEYLIIIRREKI